MLEILKSCWGLIAGLGEALLDIVLVVGVWGYEILHHLHVNAPRLEGLLIGVALAWVLLRRDNHPLLRVISAPLKLVVDILDLAWDQVVEIFQDLWGTVTGWVNGVVGWVKGKVISGYNWLIKSLKSVKARIDSWDKKEEDKK